jgi:SWI/SNF-related matrix-associated actin-dependent regulator 1 of chromatin subfamily A
LSKTRVVDWVPFDDITRNRYDFILASHLQSKENDTASGRKHLFTELRKAANHPLMLRTRHTSESEIEHLSKYLFMYGYFGNHETCTQHLVKNELEKFSDYDIHCACLGLIEERKSRSRELERYTLLENDMFCSPKFKSLKVRIIAPILFIVSQKLTFFFTFSQVLLPNLVKDDHRMLIFSQWTRCLDLLECLMESIGLRFLRLDGSTSIPERQKLIDKFNNDSCIPLFLHSIFDPQVIVICRRQVLQVNVPVLQATSVDGAR